MAAAALLSALTCVGTVLLRLLSFTAIKQVTAVRTEVGHKRWCPLPLGLPFFLTFCSSSSFLFYLCLAHLFVLDMTKTWLHHRTADMSSVFFSWLEMDVQRKHWSEDKMGCLRWQGQLRQRSEHFPMAAGMIWNKLFTLYHFWAHISADIKHHLVFLL